MDHPMEGPPDPLNGPHTVPIDLALTVDASTRPLLERGLQVSVREARLLNSSPWVRSLGKLPMHVSTEGWRFPAPPSEENGGLRIAPSQEKQEQEPEIRHPPSAIRNPKTRLRPPRDTV